MGERGGMAPDPLRDRARGTGPPLAFHMHTIADRGYVIMYNPSFQNLIKNNTQTAVINILNLHILIMT